MSDETARMDDTTTTLYRLYSRSDHLLYVGIARSWPDRMRQHATTKHWWPEVAATRLELFPTRIEALLAEREAIEQENPVYNIVHRIQREGEPGVMWWPCSVCGEEIDDGDGGAFAFKAEVARAFDAMCAHADLHAHRIEPFVLTVDGRPARAPWYLLHDECSIDRLDHPHHRVPVELLRTFDDVLGATSYLLDSRPWIAATQWHRIVDAVSACDPGLAVP